MFRASRFVIRLAPKKKAAGAAAAAAASATAQSSVRVGSTHAGKIRFDASKAGLQQVDKEYVQRVIEECSKGSPFLKKRTTTGGGAQ
ncbi:hypothetical protein AGDE_12843 [Angomonas deanei]|uniref:Uncharacterized protein n=1 Tax=Angomonas deanei TaxID=59799 RepID=A0A7G2CKY9_9TRYP|nr:hypothetical protein AGDE_12843 [Angomonas deanei]CAD2218892.1 hypothetical protein, conserved [Angomonas deanei]|eukprot:EPY23483.1 hypothetical protein AGDE_12843 [Angomonas deanei]